MAYTDNEKSTGLDVLTSLATGDLFIVGDVSDSGRAKAITQANVEAGLDLANLAGQIDLTTQVTGLLPAANIDITDLTSNSTFQTNVNAFVSGGGGGGGGTKLDIQTTQISSLNGSGSPDSYTVVIPGGTLSTNNAIKFKVFINYTDFDAGGDFIGARMSYGGTAFTDVKINVNASIQANGGGFIEGWIVADGATNAQKGILTIQAQNGTITDEANIAEQTKYDTSAVDSTINQNLVVTVLTGTNCQVEAEAIIVEKISSVQDGVIISAIAAEDVSAGQPVGLSFIRDGYVAKAFSATKSRTLPGGVHASTLWASCAISTDHVAYVYRKTALNTVSVVVVDYGTDMTATVGTEVDLTTGIESTLRNLAIAKIGTDKFVAFYVESADNTNLKGVICTVSGTTITNGAETTYASGGAIPTRIGACQLDTDKGFVVDGDNDKAYAFTVSGTTPTIGTVETTNFTGDLFFVEQLTTDKAILSANDGSATRLTAYSISGTTITEGSETTNFTDTGAIQTNSLVSHTTDAGVFSVRPSSGNTDIAVRAFTVSGTTITVGSPTTVGSADAHALGVISSSRVVLAGSTKQILSISGTTITVYTSAIPAFSMQSALECFRGAMVTANSLFIINNSTGYLMQGFSGTFVGIATATTTAGSTLSVLVSGKDANQSALISGGYYQIGSDGALTQIASSATTDTPAENAVVQAISATEIIV